MGKHEDRLLVEALRADDEVLAFQYMAKEAKHPENIPATVQRLSTEDFKKLFRLLCHGLIETSCRTNIIVFGIWLKAVLSAKAAANVIGGCDDALMALHSFARLRHADRRFLSILSDILREYSQSLIKDIQLDAINQARGTKVQNAIMEEPLCIYVVEPDADT